MNQQVPNGESQVKPDSMLKVAFTGILTFFIIVSVSILYPGLNEFVLLRFAGVDEFTASFFNSVETLAYIIVGIIIGVVSDRLGYRRPFVLLGAFLSSFMFILMTLTLSYPVLLILRFIQGACTVMAWQLLMTLAIDFAPKGKLGAAIGVFGIFLASSMGVGLMVGGILTDINVLIPFYASAVLATIAGVLAIIGLRDPLTLTPTKSLRESLAVFNRRPLLVVPVSINFVDRFHMGFLLTVLPFFIAYVLGLSASVRGMVLGIFIIPFIILQYPLGRLSDRIGRKTLLVVGSIASGVTLCLAGIFGWLSLGILIGIFILLGIFSGITSPLTFAFLGDLTSNKEKGSATAIFNVFGTVGLTLGPIVGGSLIVSNGYIIAFIVAGLIELISLAVIIPLLIRIPPPNTPPSRPALSTNA